MKVHSTALRKTDQHDALTRNAAFDLAVAQVLHCDGRSHEGFMVVFALGIESHHVVPGWHHRTLVDGYRHDRRVWKDVTNGHGSGQIQQGNHRHEVVAVGAETVQPYDGSPGLC